MKTNLEMETMKEHDANLHYAVNEAIKGVCRLRTLIRPMMCEIQGTELLDIRKSFYDTDFYLHAIELATRYVSEEEYNSDDYLEDCDTYGM